MGFPAMKLINEAGIRGTAVISVAQSSARSPSPLGMRAWAPLIWRLSLGGLKDRLGLRHRVDSLYKFPELGLVP